MKAFRILGLALAGVLTGSLAQAQGLGEAAAKEKKRREEEQKKRGSAKVVTTDDLPKGGSSSGEAPPPVAQAAPQPERTPDRRPGRRRRLTTEEEEMGVRLPPEPAARGQSQPAPAQNGPSEGGVNPGDEGLWRQRMEAARQRVKDDELQARELQEKADGLLGRILQSTDTNEQMRLRAEQQEVIASVEAAKAAAVAAREAIPVLEEEARRAGVPPGWLR